MKSFDILKEKKIGGIIEYITSSLSTMTILNFWVKKLYDQQNKKSLNQEEADRYVYITPRTYPKLLFKQHNKPSSGIICNQVFVNY